jgi:hypothetical protein
MAISMIDTIQPHLTPKRVNPDRSTRVGKGGRGKINAPRPYLAQGDMVASQSRYASQQLERLKERLNGIARQIRTADQTMDTIDKQIENMKSRLARFVKHFPPFPPGSEDRVKLLNSFTVFRKQINRLTFPPNRQLDAVPLGETADTAEIPVVPGGGSEGQVIRLQPRPVHTGPSGLNIPAMPSAETNADIKPFISTLERAQQTLGERRSGLAAEAASIPIYDDGFARSDMGEPKARQQSIEVRHTFVAHSELTIAVQHDHLRQMVA